MGAVHVRIRHDDDLVITKLCDIKIISIPFGKTAAKGVDHGLDLCIGQDLINTGLLYIQSNYSQSLAGRMETLAGDRWQEEEDQRKYLVAASDREGQVSNGKIFYVSRYFLKRTNSRTSFCSLEGKLL